MSQHVIVITVEAKDDDGREPASAAEVAATLYDRVAAYLADRELPWRVVGMTGGRVVGMTGVPE